MKALSCNLDGRPWALGLALLAAGWTLPAAAGDAFIELISPNATAEGGYGTNGGWLPDVTGDGVEEFYVNSYEKVNIRNQRCRCYVYDGRSLELLYVLMPKHTGAGGYMEGITPAGDVTGDGVMDWMAGYSAGDDGAVQVWDGESGTFLFNLFSPNPIGTLAWFGGNNELITDMTDDGEPDWLIHQTEWGSQQGRSFIFDSQTRQSIGVIANMDDDASFWGHSAISLPDLNHDGAQEVAIVHAREDVSMLGRQIDTAGRAVVRSLADGSMLYELMNPTPTPQGRFGHVIEPAPDRNNDGIPELLVGVPGHRMGAGAVMVFSGADGAYIREIGAPEGSTSDFGVNIRVVPDQNGDGTEDLVVSAGFSIHLLDGMSDEILASVDYPGSRFHSGAFALLGHGSPRRVHALIFTSEHEASYAGRAYVFPLVQEPDVQFVQPSVENNRVRLRVAGIPGAPIEVSATTDMVTWSAVSDGVLDASTGRIEIDDPIDAPWRIYRVSQPSGP